MQKIFQLIIPILLLTSCSTFFDKDNTPTPTPLKSFIATQQATSIWQTQTGNGSDKKYVKLVPAQTNDVILTASTDGNVTAVNKTNGKIIWQTNIKKPITSGIAINHTLAFVGTEKGYVVALRQDNGQQIWQSPVSSEVLAPPTANDEIVLAKSIDGRITALATTDGHALWHFQEKDPDLILRGDSAAKIQQNAIYVGFEDGSLVRLNLNSGKLNWQTNIAEPQGIFAVQRMVDIDANPIISGNRIFVVTWQGQLAALNTTDGNIIWSRKASSVAGITFDGKNIYLADQTGRVRAYNATDGKILWTQDQLIARTLSTPALMDNAILVGDGEGWLHWLDKKSGQFIARVHAGNSAIESAPLINQNIAYIYTKNGQLSAWKLY